MLLPSYNCRQYLAEALDSVLSQTYRDFHVLVIDDASTDGAPALAKDYERRWPDCVTVSTKRRRRELDDSISIGLRLNPSPRYVAIHNDDDVWRPTKLKAQIDTFKSNPGLGVVATEAMVIGTHGGPTGELFLELFGTPDAVRPAHRIFWEGNRFCATSVGAVRTGLDLLGTYYPLDSGCGDIYVWLVISAHLPVAWLHDPLTCWRRTAGHMTRARARYMWRDSFSLREHALRSGATVRNAAGGEAARRRLDGEALYRAEFYLRSGDLSSYAWVAWRVLRRCRLRPAMLIGIHTTSSPCAMGNRPA